MNPEKIVERLASFPHRGTGSPYEKEVLDYLSSLFEGKRVSREAFRTPQTFVSVVWWLLGGIIGGLLLQNAWPIVGAALVLFFGGMALLFFNWYPSWIMRFPPLVTSHNLVVNDTEQKKATKRLILMAHYDTAPISFLYRPSQVKNFHQSLQFSILLMALAMLMAVLSVVITLPVYAIWLKYGLMVYFVLQGILGSIDYLRLGFSNGASDNATGVAAAIATAQNLWQNPTEDLAVTLAIVGAEEVGYMGARAFYEQYKKDFGKETYLINFDTLGAGNLKVITQSGSLVRFEYDNVLTQKAQEVIVKSVDLQNVSTGAWHTADFDSIVFQQADIPSLTLAALDQTGGMPRIHRPEDRLEFIDFSPMHQAIILAEGIARRI